MRDEVIVESVGFLRSNIRNLEPQLDSMIDVHLDIRLWKHTEKCSVLSG